MKTINRLNTVKSLLLLFTALFSYTLLAAVHELPEFTAQYALQKYGIKVAEAKYQLSHTNNGYTFKQNTKLYGIARMLGRDTVSAVSHVEKVRGNLLMTRYTYIQTGREKNRDEDINILWQTHKNMLSGKITGTVRGKKIDLKTDGEIWDALSFQIPLMIEAREDVKEYPYKALLGGEIDTYDFVLIASEKIPFAGQEYRALHLVRKDPDRDRQLHIWTIPKLHNIPVIVENYRDGDEHSRMQLEGVKFAGEKQLLDTPDDENDDY